MDLNDAIIVDHHPVTEPIKTDVLDIREDYGANPSLLTEYLKTGKIKPSLKLATALVTKHAAQFH
jgi:nanoRNase/pAp phosphatase (c-di-AMP/oligoRNAs hydrolase)